MKTWQMAVLWALFMASPWYIEKLRLPKWAGPAAGLCAALGMVGFLVYSMPWEYTASFVALMVVASNWQKYPEPLQVVIAAISGVAMLALFGYAIYAVFTGQVSLAEMNEMRQQFPDRY